MNINKRRLTFASNKVNVDVSLTTSLPLYVTLDESIERNTLSEATNAGINIPEVPVDELWEQENGKKRYHHVCSYITATNNNIYTILHDFKYEDMIILPYPGFSKLFPEFGHYEVHGYNIGGWVNVKDTPTPVWTTELGGESTHLPSSKQNLSVKTRLLAYAGMSKHTGPQSIQGYTAIVNNNHIVDNRSRDIVSCLELGTLSQVFDVDADKTVPIHIMYQRAFRSMSTAFAGTYKPDDAKYGKMKVYLFFPY